jgi:ADP-heptose:LPS heptosyltransferase|uniref:glycosyltransferase family 9 protein n=1 Tax=Cyanobium sp. TaxID=2164130 RepID=UPI004049CE40
MRALFLIPGGSSQQLQAFAAVDAVASQLKAHVQVVCPTTTAALWQLHPAVEKVIPFAFDDATMADWANLLGSVREPDFQLCLNRASGRQVDLMLSMSHIPTRIAASGFSATEKIQSSANLWPNQAWEADLKPVGVHLNAEAFRLPIAKADLDAAAAALPPGEGPALLLAPWGAPNDWPQAQWQHLPERIVSKLPTLRVLNTAGATKRAAQVASADVVVASDPETIEWALLLGLPLVALGRPADSLPSRQGVQSLGTALELASISMESVLAALGFG